MGPILASDTGEAAGIVVFVILLLMGVLIFATLKGSDRKNNLAAVAARYGGLFASGFWEGDRVDMQVDGAPAQLGSYAGSRYQPPFTRLRFEIAPTGLLRVFPEGVFASIRKAFGSQDIDLGDDRFDEAFVVQGSPESWVRQILDTEARRRIMALASLGTSLFGGSSFSLEAGTAGVSIACGRDLTGDRVGLQAFVDHGLALYKRIAGTQEDEIQVLSAAGHASRGNCPVCASPLDGGARRCPTCATPHHADCWGYFGGCAIYGCRGGGGKKS